MIVFNKSRLIIVFAVMIYLITGCSGSKVASTNSFKSTSKTVSDILAENTGDSNTKNNDANHGGNITNPNDTSNKFVSPPKIVNSQISAGSNLKQQKNLTASDIDIDLTRMSSTMVYSEVYNMMMDPDKYIGKVVRMDGNLAVYKYPERNYYTCLIKDAAACCQQGMEFLWEGNHKYPDDYPEEGDEIIVTGIFDVYYEEDMKYCQLKDATLVEA